VTILLFQLFPNIEFRTAHLNRIYGIFFHVISISLFGLLFLKIKELKQRLIRRILLFVNIIVFFLAIIDLPLYIMKIDPDIQYYDSKILYVNSLNNDEKIVRQYLINWKTNEKIYMNNHVKDVGYIRIFKTFNIDTMNLKKEWIKK